MAPCRQAVSWCSRWVGRGGDAGEAYQRPWLDSGRSGTSMLCAHGCILSGLRAYVAYICTRLLAVLQPHHTAHCNTSLMIQILCCCCCCQVAEARLLNLQLSGSLLVHADCIMGHVEGGGEGRGGSRPSGSRSSELPAAEVSQPGGLLRYSNRCVWGEGWGVNLHPQTKT